MLIKRTKRRITVLLVTRCLLAAFARMAKIQGELYSDLNITGIKFEQSNQFYNPKLSPVTRTYIFQGKVTARYRCTYRNQRKTRRGDPILYILASVMLPRLPC